MFTGCVHDNLTFRLFQDRDAPALTDLLHRAYAPFAARGLNYSGVDQSMEVTLERANSGATWMLYEGDLLVGSVTMSLPPMQLLQDLTAEARVPGRVWFGQFAVAPGYQRRGYGSLLKGRSFTWARQQGATSVGLDTGLLADDLISLYAHWGFQAADIIQRPGRTYKSLVMTRPLNLTGTIDETELIEQARKLRRNATLSNV